MGDRLFVDRGDELRRVGFRLSSGGGAVCLDGPVGVGKTSLANVASYRAMQAYLANPKNSLLLPCRQSFQVSSEETADEFRIRVLTEVAQTLLEQASTFRIGLNMEGRDGIDKWLNSPLLTQWSGGVPILSAGFGAQSNESAGYSQSGFARTVIGWLENIFPENETGGVICVLDNLELLETSSLARKKIETLRDTLFTIRGLRWILCGAHGILQGVVSSQRLVGHLQEPVFIAPLALQKSHAVFNARVDVFGRPSGNACYLPMEAGDFDRVYLIVHRNLRNALAYADEYCMHIAEGGVFPSSTEDKRARFDSWLKNRATSIRDAVKSQLAPTALGLFRTIADKMDGELAPGDFKALGFQSVQAMRPHIRSLEEVGLLETQRDEIDQRRKSISVTGKGWLVHWCEITD